MNPWEEYAGSGQQTSAAPWEEYGGATPTKNSSDVKTAFVQGIKEVPGSITGLADIPAGLAGFNRPFSRAANAVGEAIGFQPSKYAKADEAKYSDAHKAQKAEIDAIEKDPNKGFKDMAEFYAKNPGYTGLNIVRSIPSMLLGGVYAKGLKATGLGAVSRGAAGEGAVMAGQQMESIDPKVDPARAALASLATGTIGAGIGALGGRVAQKAGLADVDTLLAGGGRGTGPVDLVKRGIVGRSAMAAGQEGLLEELPQSLVEQGAKNLAEEKPFTQGMVRAGMEGTLAGSAMGAGAGAISRSRSGETAINANPTEHEEPDQAAEVAQEAMQTAPEQQAPAQDTPPAPATNPLIEQQQQEQEQEARAQEAKAKRDAIISKVGGVVPIAGTNMSLFNGKPYHNDDPDGALDKQIAKLQEAEDQKPTVRRAVEDAYVSAFNDMNKTAIEAGEVKPLTFANITGKVAKLVGGAQDAEDAASRISAQIDLKVGANGKVSPEVELLQDVYEKLTGEEHPSIASVQKIQKQEKADAHPKSSVVQPAAKTNPVAAPAVPDSQSQPVGGSSNVGVQPSNAGSTQVPAQKLVTVTRQGKQVQLPKETIARDLSSALTDPKKAPVIQDVTGTDTGTTMTFREAAIASLTRQKKPTTEKAVENERKRIHKMLAGLGITEAVVDKVSATQASTPVEEVSAQPDEGVSIVNSPNASVAIEPLTPKQKKLQGEADKIMKEQADVKTPDVVTAKEQEIEKSIEERRRAEAESNRRKAIAAAARSPYAKEVGEDWDDMADVLDGVTPKFDQLADIDKAALVDYYSMYKNGDISYAEFEKEQRDIARSQETIHGSANHPRLDSGVHKDDTGAESSSEKERPGLPQSSDSVDSSSAESGSTPTKAPVVAIKKKRAVKPEPKEEPEPVKEPQKAVALKSEAKEEPKAEVKPEPKSEPKAEVKEEPKQAGNFSTDQSTHPKAALDHAKDLGGEVVYSNGDLSLIRGSSLLSGQSVYVGAKGDTRTRVDISGFTGKFIPESGIKELQAARDKIVAADELALKAHPDGPFTGAESNVVGSESVPDSYVMYLTELANSLGLQNLRIFLLHPDDARSGKDRYHLNGGYSSAMSAGLDSGENGSMRQFGPDAKDFYISLDPKLSEERAVETIAHELGHIIERVAFEKASPETKSAIRAEHEAWLKQNKGKSAVEVIDSLRNRETAAAHTEGVDKAKSGDELSYYWKSFSEWFADNVSKWATTSEKPVSIVEKFFSDLGKKLKDLARKILGKKYNPTKGMKAFLDAMGPANPVVWKTAQNTKAEKSKAPSLTPTKGIIERNVSKLPPSLQGPAFIAATNIKDIIQRGVMGLSFGHDLADMVAKTLPSAKKFFDAMDRKEAVKNRLEIEIDKIASEAYKATDKEALNKFLKISTRTQKWGYQPSWMDKVEIDPVAQTAYDKLSTASRSVADKIFKHGYESRMNMAATVRAEINAGFDEELKLASEADKAKIKEKRKAEMHLFDTQFNSFKGPYAPLSRFGDFVMVAKSQERIDAEKRGDTKWLNKEGTKPEHYRVEFHDSLGAAKWAAKQLEGTYANTVGATKQAYAKGMSEAPWSALRRLKMMVNEHFKDNSEEGKKAITQINQLLKDLYLSNLAETSARKHDLKRKDIEGASDDMLRAFASKGKADAHFMAALMHTGEVQDALTEMRNEAHGTTENSSGRADRTNAFNEILRRHAGSMDYRPTPIQDKILMLNSVWMLLTKPSYYLQNATQPFMMSLPVMAGRHGYMKSASTLTQTYKDLADGFGKDSAVKGFLDGNFDVDAMPIKADEKSALKKLLELGILDIGINMDMGYWESRGGLAQPAVDVAHRMTTLVKQVEVMNRVTTALTAYRLAGGGVKGIEEAKHIVRTTHGNYSTFNAPSLLNNVPKIVVQFRKFQLIQLAMMSRLVHQSFKGDSKEVKAAARASFAYTLGHYFVMAGALGMPAMSLIGMGLAAAFGDEEEPEDFELLARRAIGNDEVADVLLKGAPTLAGMDLSGTLGASTMTSILPFTDIKLDSKKGFGETMLGLLGPAIGGTAPKMADGIGLMGKGEIYKGFEKMLPTGLANAMKAYRESSEGMTNKNGDLTLSPEEISLWDSFLTSLSIRTQTAAKTQLVQGAKIDFENFYKERTGEIKHRYVKAWKEGDGDTMADMREEWQNVQMSKAKNGFAKQPMSDLVRAPREQQKRERNTAGGVQFQKNSRRFVQETAGL